MLLAKMLGDKDAGGEEAREGGATASVWAVPPYPPKATARSYPHKLDQAPHAGNKMDDLTKIELTHNQLFFIKMLRAVKAQ